MLKDHVETEVKNFFSSKILWLSGRWVVGLNFGRDLLAVSVVGSTFPVPHTSGSRGAYGSGSGIRQSLGI